jgi:methylated-DNA-[protein]-cysteine S-methyltransferase
MSEIFVKPIRTPIGNMLAMATCKGLCALEFDQESRRKLWEQRSKNWFSVMNIRDESNVHIEHVERWLDSYFAKRWNDLPAVTLDQRGSEFELRVWAAMRKIPPGKTKTYGELAKELDTKSGARAVGNASRRNPMSLIVPCHRIVGAGANLTGYGGGLSAKAQLLQHEGWCICEENRP